MGNIKDSEFSQVSFFDTNAMVVIHQGTPLDNKKISITDFGNSLPAVVLLQNTKVSNDRTINGYVLSNNINLNANDIGAYTITEVNDLLFNKVSKMTTINGRELTTNITLLASDLSTYTSGQTDTLLNNKVDKNVPISGGTFTKITYDSKGLVTSGQTATTNDIPDSVDKRYVTDALYSGITHTNRTVIDQLSDSGGTLYYNNTQVGSVQIQTDFNQTNSGATDYIKNKPTITSLGGYTSGQTDTLLSSKANDNNVVHTTGNESIGGVKTFTNTTDIVGSNGNLTSGGTLFNGGVVVQKKIASQGDIESGSKIFGSSISAKTTKSWGDITSLSVDVGGGLPGSSSYSVLNDAWTITAGGTDIWGYPSKYHYRCQQVTGDYTMVVRVKSFTQYGNWQKMGIIFTDGLTDGSLLFDIMTSDGGTGNYNNGNWISEKRTVVNGAASGTYGVDGNSYPNCWLKITRTGNDFYSFTSPDGINWTNRQSASISMSSTYYVGIGGCQNGSSTCTAVFDNVSPVILDSSTNSELTPSDLKFNNQLSNNHITRGGVDMITISDTYVQFNDTTEATTTVDGGTRVSGGLSVAKTLAPKRIYQSELTGNVDGIIYSSNTNTHSGNTVRDGFFNVNSNPTVDNTNRSTAVFGQVLYNSNFNNTNNLFAATGGDFETRLIGNATVRTMVGSIHYVENISSSGVIQNAISIYGEAPIDATDNFDGILNATTCYLEKPETDGVNRSLICKGVAQFDDEVVINGSIKGISQLTKTTTANTQYNDIESIPLSTKFGIKYIMKITEESKMRLSEIMVLNNGTTVNFTEYAIVEVGGSISNFVMYCEDGGDGNYYFGYNTQGGSLTQVINVTKMTI